MAKDITAKPTIYRDIHFKSRLEARWAIFLDHCPGVAAWQYEPYQFSLPNGWTYTPDFYVTPATGPKFWIEVKPIKPTKEYLKNIWEFVHSLTEDFCVGYGSFYKGAVPCILPLTGPCTTKDMSLYYWFKNPRGIERAVKTASEHRFDLGKPKRTYRRRRR